MIGYDGMGPGVNANEHHRSASDDSSGDVRQCWICFSEEPVAPSTSSLVSRSFVGAEEWVRPCRCRGTTRWVHQHCLLSWVESLSANMVASKLQCPQCHTEYRLAQRYILPRWMLRGIDRLCEVKEEMLLYASVSGVALSAYLISFAYGTGAIVAVLGWEEIPRLMGMMRHAPFLWQRNLALIRGAVGIPIISLYVLSLRYRGMSWLHPLLPLFLIEDVLSVSLRNPFSRSTVASLVPIMADLYHLTSTHCLLPRIRRWLVPDLKADESQDLTDDQPLSLLSQLDASLDSASEATEERNLKISITETTSTLLFPFVSAAVGYLVFGRLAPRMDPLHRSLLGGLIVVVGRDVIRTLRWYQGIVTQRSRRILDFASHGTREALDKL